MATSKIYSYYDPKKGMVDSLVPAAGAVGDHGFLVLGEASLFTEGLSGSLTQLSDGISYLVAGDNVTITTASNGQVTISAEDTAGVGTGVGWFAPSTDVISTSGSVFFGVDVGSDNPDITFGDNGSANFNVQQNSAGDFRVASDNKAGVLIIDGGTEQIGLLTDGTEAADAYGLNASTDPIPEDTGLFVSGSIGAKDSSIKGTSVFGGDVMVSGTLVANRSDDGAYPAIKIDKDYTGTTDVGSLASGGTDPAGLVVDYDVTGIVASGQTAYHDAIAVHYNQDAPTHVGTCNATGADIRMTGGTSGDQTIKGAAVRLVGASSCIGLDVQVPDGETSFIARSGATIVDFFKISVDTNGVTTLLTQDGIGGSLANLVLDVDGDINIEGAPGKEVVFNEAGANVDFRVESDDKTHALFVNAGNDQVIFHSSSAVPGDVSFYVSGSTGISDGISLFGGDLFTSGNMHVGTVASDSGGTALYLKNDKIIFNSSDVRLKTNIRNIENPLDKVTLLAGYRYNSIDDSDDSDYFGFLGQEVEKIAPELSYTTPNGYMGVRYAETTALLVEAIKELKGEVNRLSSELKDTKEQLSEAHTKLSELDTDVDQVFENLTAYVDQKHAENKK